MVRTPSLSAKMIAVGCLTGIALLISSCRKPAEFVYEDDSEEGPVEIVVADGEGNVGNLPEGATLGVYSVDGDGNVTLSTVQVDEDGKAVLPASGSGTVVYTPYQEDWGEEAFFSNAVFTVRDSQDTEEAYIASDLIIGNGSTFRHMLSKVVVNIIDDIGLGEISETEVVLLNACNSVTVDLAAQSVSTVEIRRRNIRMLSETASDWRYTSCAIVAPQSLRQGTPFFSVTLSGDSPQVFGLPEDASLESGSTFVLNLRLTQQGLIPDGWSVTDWDSSEEQFLNIIQ